MKSSIISLTRRETEVAHQIACGLPTKQIADTLKISMATVNNLIASAYEKLGLHSKSELTAYYLCRFYGASPEFDTVGNIKKALTATVFMALVVMGVIFDNNDQMIRARRGRRRNETEMIA